MGAGPRLARATPRARPAVLDRVLGRTDAEVAGRFDPAYAAAIGRLPAGRQVFHGLPFDLGPAGAARWMILDEPVTLDLRGQGPATHLVIAHLCDSWRDEDGSRPAAIPIGHVVPVGEPLARYRVTDAAGRTTTRTIRRRFEIDDGILGWGSLPFAAVPHLANAVIDWRGPHPTQPRGSYAPPGQSGALTVLPGAWGPAQTGVSDFVPSSTGEALLWLHAIALTGDEDGTDDRGRAIEPVEVAELRLESLTGGRPGSDVIVAGVTLYDGTANPLIRGERFQLLLDGSEEEPETDLGTVIRTLAAGPASHRRPEAAAPIVGWGEPRAAPRAEDAPGDEARIVDIALHDDAVLSVGTWSMPATDLRPGTGTILRSPSGRTTIRALPTPRIRVDVRVLDEASSTTIPARVRFVAEDGRYLPPVAHQDEVNPGLYEDLGADVRLGSAIYAYVPGRFRIDLPLGGVEVEAVAGFDRRPRRFRMDVGADTHELDIELERAFDLRPAGWVTTDAHVHFLAPSTALLQAAAEDINLVHLLATQWGDLFTSVTDLPWGSMSDPSGRHQVIVGTENRQNVLGHLGLLGARDPVMPMASAGPPEGRMAGALTALLADWADRCRAAGGLVVAAHFPLPYAEIAADILSGRIDAVEAQALAPGLDDPTILEWYRFLNAGQRLPILGGTDKMSAEVPVGAVRTYTRLADGVPLSFDGWAAAVRAGRTFVTSGPVIELSVEGREPGDVIALPGGGGRLAVRVRARAAQPVISGLELVLNGRVVAATASAEGSTDLHLDEAIDVTAGAWIAARSRSSHHIESAFATSMAAHTSPVYVEVPDRPIRPSADDGAVIAAIIDGARTWVAELATVPDPAERSRMTAFFDDSLRILEERLG